MIKIIVHYENMKKGEHKHAQSVIKELGITSVKDIPESMGDCWIFYGCENIPECLPGYISVSEMKDHDYQRSGINYEKP